MSHTEITLTASDKEGRSRQVAVESARFTIGSGYDNDLAIDDAGLSRRHALIERVEGIAQISDCWSERGTYVNGNRIEGVMSLRDGDRISIGLACDILVSINYPQSAVATDQKSVEQDSAPGLRPNVMAQRLTTQRFITPVIALGSVVVIMLLVVAVAVFVNKGRASRDGRISYAKERQGKTESQPGSGSRQAGESGENKTADSISKEVNVDQVEKVAAQFMRRISSDDRPYVFPPYAVAALGDIRQRVEHYSSSPTLVAALNSVATAAPAIAAEARREGIEPSLVICVTLAEIEGGQTSNPVTAARRIMPELLSLRKTLGTESADKSMILIAAYKMGGGTKKSHPLLRTMTRVVKNPLTDRNVWYLREHTSLDDGAYNFVVSFIALGVIAENPRRFNVAAPAVAY